MSGIRISIPRIYMGTMTFGWNQTSQTVDETIALEMMHRFVKSNSAIHDTHIHPIDTARIYAGGNTESILGSTLQTLRGLMAKDASLPGNAYLSIGTKAHPSQPMGLSSEGIKRQFEASLKAMNLDRIDEFYLHQPDTENTLLESLQTLHQLVEDGYVSSIGMSNYHVSEMSRAFHLCDQYSLTKPSVYQGLYNPLNRVVEDELIPVLRENNCSFVAFNPLAAGLLTGKHQRTDIDTSVKKGRFKDNPNYLPRFFTPANFDGLEVIQKMCDKKGITIVEATYRWLLRHSILSEKDGLLLGSSSISQLYQNLACCSSAMTLGPLQDCLLDAFDEAWEITKDGAFPYWRSYSSDMPNRDNLDHGASYAANKVKN